MHRWVLYAEHRYCARLSHWKQAFDSAHAFYATREDNGIIEWLTDVRSQIYAGRQALDYLGRVMEGELPDDDEGVRDLYVQAYRLSSSVQEAVIGLECRVEGLL